LHLHAWATLRCAGLSGLSDKRVAATCVPRRARVYYWRKEFKPGTLIVIPKGTAHGGTLVTSGPVKAIAIKIPPQGPTDTVFMN